MRNRTGSVMAALMLMVSGSLQAQVVAGRWDKVDRLQLGKELIVKLTAGDRIEGRFRSSTPDALVLTDSSSKERTIPKAGIAKVVGHEKIRDGYGNGSLIGSAIGLGIGVAVDALHRGEEVLYQVRR
jgi:hypothetical protein